MSLPVARSRRAAPLSAAGALVGLLLVLAGCSTLSKEQCQSGDWYQIGVVDGRNGKSSAILAEHEKACARYKIGVDAITWQRGRSEGLKDYCTPVSGFANGSAGKSYENVCTGRAGADFLTAYGLGTDVYQARSEARELADEARRAENEEDRIADEIRDLRRRMRDASDDERDDIRDRIANLQSRRFGFDDGFSARMDAARAAREAEIAEARARAAFTDIFGYPPY